MPIKNFFTLKEAVALLQEDSSDEDADNSDCRREPEICILPPDDGAESEVEGIDEDDLNPVEPPDVSGHVHVFTGNDDSESGTNLQCTQSATNTRAETSLPGRPKRKRKEAPASVAKPTKRQRQTNKTDGKNHEQQGKVRSKWKTSNDKLSPELPDSSPPVLADVHPELICKSPVELFEVMFDEEMFEHMKEQFELYARRDKNFPDFNTSAAEIRKFVGILLLSGYNCLPRERDYWSTADDLGCSIVTKTMSKNRFQELKKFCHLADNRNLSQSKVAKLLPIYDRLNRALLQFGVFDRKLSIDESMEPYYGHHGAKMFIRGKHIRFGYKLWMLCSSDGYPYQANIYCGKTERPQERSLGEHVVLSLVDLVPVKSQHELYFDNFFSSYSLFLQLRELQMKATGTIREGRYADAKLADKSKFNKTERGKFEYCSDGKICIVRWSDNNVVTCGSNFDCVNPVNMVERRVKGANSKAKVPQPRMIGNYTAGMGGVDLCDRLLSAYRPRIKGKKWYWNLFVNALNIATVAAWKIHCKVLPSQHLTHLEFLREVVAGLLKSVSRQRLGGPTAPVPSCVRYDGFEHYIESTSQGRCAYCTKNTMKQCAKCGKRLHEICFQIYHTKSD